MPKNKKPKTRNPFVEHMRFKKSGAHVKSKKAIRKQEKEKLRKQEKEKLRKQGKDYFNEAIA